MTQTFVKQSLKKIVAATFVAGLVLSSIGSTTAFADPYRTYRQDMYGAIAYSSATGANGYSYNYTSRSVAQGRALNACEARSGRGDCRVVIWFRNACGAVAVASNGAYGSGWATRLDVAESYAVNSCRQYGNNSCRVTRWVCTGY